MQRISTTPTEFYKWSRPILVGILACVCADACWHILLSGQDAYAAFLFAVMALVMTGGAIVVWRGGRAYIEEVFDDGDALVMRRGAIHVRIALRAIQRIELEEGKGDGVIQVWLKQACEFGEQVTFLPVDHGELLPRRVHKRLVEDLQSRVRIAHADEDQALDV